MHLKMHIGVSFQKSHSLKIYSFAVARREENCLHYDEVSKFYPEEYEILF
jgi:hypothetical protein